MRASVNTDNLRSSSTAIFVQALTANIFSRLFSFENARLKFKQRVGRWKRDCYRNGKHAKTWQSRPK